MRSLLAVITLVTIAATFPATDAVQAAAEHLRQAAVTAGCLAPVVAMRWLGGAGGIEVTVTCPR